MDKTVEEFLEKDRQIAQTVMAYTVNSPPAKKPVMLPGAMTNLAYSLPNPSPTQVRALFEARGDVDKVEWERTGAGQSIITITYKDGRDPQILEEGKDYYIKDDKSYFYNNVRGILEAQGVKVDWQKMPDGGSTIDLSLPVKMPAGTEFMTFATLVEGKDYFIGADGKAHFLDTAYGQLPPGVTSTPTEPNKSVSSSTTNSTSTDVTGSKDNAKVTFGSSVNSSVVSEHTIDVLGKIAANAGEENIKITSTIRTPQSQASAMYDNAKNTSWDSQMGTYGSTGKAVLKAGKEAQKAAENDNPNISSTELRTIVVAAMEKEIISQSEKGNRTSKHVVTTEQYAKLNVVDIGYGSISDKNAFEEELKAAKKEGLIENYLREDNNGCFHIEISVPQK